MVGSRYFGALVLEALRKEPDVKLSLVNGMGGMRTACMRGLRSNSIAQMSFGLSGGFWPTSVPLLQAVRFAITSMTDSVIVDRSPIFRHGQGAAIGDDALCVLSANSDHLIVTA